MEFKPNNIEEIYDLDENTKENIEKIDLSVCNISGVDAIDMRGEFFRYSSLKELDLSNFDTSKTKCMACMFKECTSLTELNLSNFDTSNVRDMDNMFYGCSSLEEIDLSSFDTSNVKYMSGIFDDCNNLKTVKLSDKANNLEEYINKHYPDIAVEKINERDEI